MSASFAPVRWPARLAAARGWQPPRPAVPANDNSPERTDELTLEAALRHFAAHGLGAASAACAQAEAHWHRGDRQAAGMWLAICRVLDKRLAQDLERRLAETATQTA